MPYIHALRRGPGWATSMLMVAVLATSGPVHVRNKIVASGPISFMVALFCIRCSWWLVGGVGPLHPWMSSRRRPANLDSAAVEVVEELVGFRVVGFEAFRTVGRLGAGHRQIA